MPRYFVLKYIVILLLYKYSAEKMIIFIDPLLGQLRGKTFMYNFMKVCPLLALSRGLELKIEGIVQSDIE